MPGDEGRGPLARRHGSRWPVHLCCRSHLDSLHFELHVILSGGLPVFPLLPAVAIFPVLHLLAVVEDHRAILRPEEDEMRGESSERRSFLALIPTKHELDSMTLLMAVIVLFLFLTLISVKYN